MVAELPASLCAGAKGFSISVSAEGADLAKPTKAYLGLKFQMHVVDKSTGYDLINEPYQNGRAKNDYWTLQRRAAGREAVR